MYNCLTRIARRVNVYPYTLQMLIVRDALLDLYSSTYIKVLLCIILYLYNIIINNRTFLIP